jgi:hypothetical protein
MSTAQSTAEKADLVRSMRRAAEWRKRQAQQFADDVIAQRRSHRAMVAIQVAAKFVEGLDPDDRDLRWLSHLETRHGRVTLCEASLELLNRFGIDQGAWQSGPPNERQIRNLLRRMDGSEAAERGAQRRDSR